MTHSGLGQGWWVLSALFLVAGAVMAIRALREVDARVRVDDLAHVLMCAVMAVMPTAWYGHLPVALQIVVFSSATLWFVGRALFWRPPAGRTGHGPRSHAYHATMMGAMVWMAVAMSPSAAAQVISSSGALTGASTPGAMPGMTMAGGAAATMPESMPMSMTGHEAWVLTLTWAFGVFFALAAAVFTVRVLGRVIDADRLEWSALSGATGTAVNALMAAGMAGSLLILTT